MQRKIFIIHLETIDSTNRYAKNHISSFDLEKITCIVSESQTAGKGRFERQWISFPNVGLYFTLVFRLKNSSSQNLGILTLMMAKTVADVLERLKKVFLKIKWPNDLMLNDKKMGGILAEAILHPSYVDIIMGVGLNLNTTFDQLQSINQAATSLFLETGQKVLDKDKILHLILEEWQKNLDIFEKFSFDFFISYFEKKLCYFHEKITFFDGQNQIEATLHSIEKNGSLNLLVDGKIQNFLSGEIVRSKH